MRFLVMVKSDPKVEQMKPVKADMEAMGRYNQTLRDAGVLLSVDGLLGSKYGARVTYSKGEPMVKDGPFTESKELVGGFWIIDVKSKEEAVNWTKSIPFANGESVEIRRIAEASDVQEMMK